MYTLLLTPEKAAFWYDFSTFMTVTQRIMTLPLTKTGGMTII